MWNPLDGGILESTTFVIIRNLIEQQFFGILQTFWFRNPENQQFFGIQLINSKLDVQVKWNLRDS